MRPYLAILRDSFREAVASRTLPFLLVLFTVILLALAPIGLREEIPWRLRPADLADLRLFTLKLRNENAKEGDNPAKRVLARLPESLRTRLTDGGAVADDRPPEENPFGPTELQQELADAVNDHVLTDREFYAAAAWEGRDLPDEAKRLLDRTADGRFSEDEVRRLNRLLFDAAFSGAVVPAPKSSAEVVWLGNDIPLLSDAIRQVSVDKAEVQRQAQDILRVVNSWFVGPIALLVAIFVTSPVIPRMFEPGAIDLLLSKPVSRTGVFLTRFFSGCAFVLITFSYFIVGVWLIVGLRLDVWNNGLLLAIPLLMFGFAVIYSISAATGVVWRNPIISVLAAVIVWGAAYAVGVTHDLMSTFRNGDKVREIVPADETLVIADKNGNLFEWSSSARDWKPIMEGPERQVIAGLVYPLVGPVYDPKGDRIIAGDVGPGGTDRLFVGSRASGWERNDGAMLPPATRSLFVTNDGRLLAVGSTGIFRFEGEPAAKAAEWRLWGLNLAPADTKNGFVRIDADGSADWSMSAAAAVDRKTGAITVVDAGKAVRFEPTDGGYRKAAEWEIDTKEPAVVGMAGGRLVAAFRDGAVRLFDAESLDEVATVQLPKGDPPKSAGVSPGGDLAAVVTHGGRLALFDTEAGRPIDADVTGQGNISAVTFAPDGSLWVADRLKRLTRYDGETFETQETLTGKLSRAEMIYRYVMRPLRWILPNTYGLRNAETYLFTDRKSEAIEGPDAHLESERLTYDVWGPIWQNAAFLAVVLGLTCVYVARKDF